MVQMKKCKQHSDKSIEFVCLDKLCKAITCFACFSCVRTTHKNCSDETLLDIDEFMNLEICYVNKQNLSKEIMNRTNIDLRRALGAIRQTFLKKKDISLDFLSLTQKDFLDNFPRVHALYHDFLIFNHAHTQKGYETKEEITVTSKYKFKSLKEREKDLEKNIMEDFEVFMKSLMDMKNCYLEPIIPKEAEFYKFSTDTVEVSKVEGKTNVLEFYSKNENNEQKNSLMKNSFFGKSSKQKSDKKENIEIVIDSKEELQKDHTWK
jgi:hypothetical protein